MSMNIEIRDHLTEAQIADLYRLYQGEWWTNQRQEAEIRTMLKNCDLLFALVNTENDQLVGFARVLTDYVFKALILDVIVDESQRGSGLGRRLVEAITNHPALKEVRHLELYCRPDKVPFYQKWGFARASDGFNFMRITR